MTYTFHRSDATFSAVTDSDISATAWTTYTPTIAAGSGTFTSVSATGRYKQIGKTVFLSFTVTITTNGTAGTYVSATLPVSATGIVLFHGRSDAGGNSIYCVGLGATSGAILDYSAAYPGADGAVLRLSGVYEAA